MSVQRSKQEWIVNHAPAVSLQATASKAAGAAGVSHVATGVQFNFSAGTAVVATTVTVNLRDGASGAGTVLAAWSFALPAATIPAFSVSIDGFNVRGSPATAMTLEFSALLANLVEGVTLYGYDDT